MTKQEIKKINELLEQFKEEELPEWNERFSYDAEIWSGMRHFIKWLNRKSNDSK